jgi:hypothetical protein
LRRNESPASAAKASTCPDPETFCTHARLSPPDKISLKVDEGAALPFSVAIWILHINAGAARRNVSSTLVARRGPCATS